MPQFSVIKSRVEDYVLDLPSETQALVGAWVNKAVKDAERSYNFRHMESLHEATTTSGTRKLDDKPSDWKESRAAPWLHQNDGGSKRIKWAPSDEQMVVKFTEDDSDDDGEPEFVLEEPDSFDVFPLPDGDSEWSDGEYRVKLPYWAYSAELSADSDTNWFTGNADWYLVYSAAAEGAEFNLDFERAKVLREKAAQEFRRIVSEDKHARVRRGLTLTPRSDVHAPFDDTRL